MQDLVDAVYIRAERQRKARNFGEIRIWLDAKEEELKLKAAGGSGDKVLKALDASFWGFS